jgi:hypothetical protein
VFTTWGEWKAGPYPAEQQICQTCHMPATRAEVATGSGPRDGVRNHSFFGSDGALRKTALALTVAAEDRAGKLVATVTLANVGSGHALPTGLPERRLIVRAAVTGDSGQVVAVAEKVYGRYLVDAAGKPAAFYAAVREERDDRLGPRERRVETFELDAPAQGKLSVTATWRALPDDLARSLGLAEIRQELLAEASISFGAPRPGGGRAGLPRRVDSKPKARAK